MLIKKGDNVKVITGKDKGKTGSVVRAFPDVEKVIIDGVNVKKRHVRKRGRDQQGDIVERSHPIHVSNVMVMDPKENKPTRIGKQYDEKKKKWVRIAKKSGTVL